MAAEAVGFGASSIVIFCQAGGEVAGGFFLLFVSFVWAARRLGKADL